MLSRDQILANAKNVKREVVNVPEWGTDVFVRGMSAAERQRHLNVIREKGDKPLPPDLYAKVVSWCVVDESGRQVFNEKDVQDLAEGSGIVIDRIYKVVERLSFLSVESRETLKGNSEPTLN